jgi:hypothetical protein
MNAKKATKAPKSEKPHAAKKARAKKSAEPKEKKMSALDAAAKILAEKGDPMTSKEMIEAMGAKGYWTSPGGQTPTATLYAAIIREISKKGADSRFQKSDRGEFTLNTGAKPKAKAPAKKGAAKAKSPKPEAPETESPKE